MIFVAMGNSLNRIGNTISIPGRLVKTGLTAGADIFDTLAAIPKDIKDVVSYTSDEIKNIFKSACKKGKRYQRIGNTLLSPFVALGAAVEGAVRSVVTPATNFVTNTFNTGKNLVKNTVDSTFGSLFSKNPVSDFKYDELKTANVIEKNKNWFSKWRLGRKVFQDNEQKVNNSKPQPTELSQSNQIKEPNQTGKGNQSEKVNEVEKNIKKEKSDKEMKSSEDKKTNKDGNNKEAKGDEKVNDGKTKKGSKDVKEGKNTKESGITKENENGGEDAKGSKNTKESKDSKESEDLKENKADSKGDSDNGATDKKEEKEDKKKEKTTEGSEKTEKTEKKGETEAKDEKKEDSDKPAETTQQNPEHKGVDEAKRILSDSNCGKIIIDRLCESHKDFGIIFDNTTSIGRCNEDHTITIGTKMPNGITALSPFNWEAKNPETQKKHLLLHELSHGVIHSHAQEIPGIQEGLNLIKQYIEARKNIDGKTLSLLSYRNNTYGTTWEKAREDFVEMLALRMDGNGSLCKKYLKLLSDNEHKSFRENHGLARITKEHAAKLQSIFDSIIHYYENLSN